MGLLFETALLDVGDLVACLLAVVHIYFKMSASYWKERKVPYIEPIFHFGNFRDLIFLRKPIEYAFADLYKKLDGEKHGGIYMFMKTGFIFVTQKLLKMFWLKTSPVSMMADSLWMKRLTHFLLIWSFFLERDGEIFAPN
jgi:hypothetical protein